MLARYRDGLSRSRRGTRRDARRTSCPTAGTPTFRPSTPTPRASPAAMRAARCSTRSCRSVPWLIGGSADLAPSTKTDIKRRRIVRAGQLWRRELPFRRARARHGRGGQRHGAVAPARLRPHLPGVRSITCARRCGCRRSWRSARPGSSRTIRSASARTGRRTSRSSIWRRCARSPGSTRSARATPTKSRRRGRRSSATATTRPR